MLPQKPNGPDCSGPFSFLFLLDADYRRRVILLLFLLWRSDERFDYLSEVAIAIPRFGDDLGVGPDKERYARSAELAGMTLTDWMKARLDRAARRELGD